MNKREMFDPRNARRADPRLLLHARALWPVMARPEQRPPPKKEGEDDWLVWLLLGGRGAGKTRAGAEWVREQVWQNGKRHIALVAPSFHAAREVMIEGESGLKNIGYVEERPDFTASRRLLTWKNGATGYVFSADEPNGLRGPQFDCAWADEFCAWNYPDETLSNLRLGLRLGADKGSGPQLTVTTTPRNSRSLAALMDMPGLTVSRMKTGDNHAHLAPNFLAMMQAAYGGTTLARQEIGGEIVEDIEGGLWTRALFDKCRTAKTHPRDKIIVAVDPPARLDASRDACGIIVMSAHYPALSLGPYAEKTPPSKAYILEDASVQDLTTCTWAEHVVRKFRAWNADYVVAECNMGGDLVKTAIQQIDPGVPVRLVRATRGKRTRAEPVHMLYEQGRVKHEGLGFEKLEDELIYLGSTQGYHKSPDRADALVWGVTDLLIDKAPEPQVRALW